MLGLLPRDLDLGALPGMLAARHARHAALEVDGRVRSFASVEDEVGRLTAAHRAHGHLYGARVGVALSGIDVALHVCALVRAGAVAVPVNPRLPCAEIRALLEAAGASAVVVDDLALDGALAGGAARVCPRRRLSSWLDANPRASSSPEPRRRPQATAVVLSTSGTTGTPKLAPLTSADLLAFPRMLVEAPRLVGHRRVLSALPMTHVAGLQALFGSWCAGACFTHVDGFRAADVLDVIERRSPDAFVGVPTMYADLEAAGADAHDLSSVMLWVSGADAMSAARARRFQERGALVRAGRRRLLTAAFADVYGMVETAGAVAVRLYPPAPRGLRAPVVGVVLPHVEARVVDDDGLPVAPGAVGLLELRRRVHGAGRGRHARDAQATVIAADRWLATDDLVRLWPGGVIAVVGRRRERLKVGGFSVFPGDVEDAMRAYPAVRDAALVGEPDARLGEHPVALVVADGALDADAMLAWLKGRVAGYQRPTRVVVVDALPRTRAGKVDRDAAARIAHAA